MLRKGRFPIHVAATCAVFALVGCAHKAPPPPPQVTPVRPPPILCLPIPGEPEPQGGVIRPITPQEIDAFDRLVDYELNLKLYAREGWGRAKVAKDTYCR